VTKKKSFEEINELSQLYFCLITQMHAHDTSGVDLS